MKVTDKDKIANIKSKIENILNQNTEMGKPDFDLNRELSDDESGGEDKKDSNFITDYKIIT